MLHIVFVLLYSLNIIKCSFIHKILLLSTKFFQYYNYSTADVIINLCTLGNYTVIGLAVLMHE